MIKNELTIEQFCEEVEKIPVLFRDEDEYEESIITFNSYDIMRLGVDIQRDKCLMDIYLSFGYSDIPPEQIKKQDIYALEELDNNEYEFWQEKYFTFFLSQNGSYSVSVWDDGSYMCPGYVARIGYQDISCEINTIIKFINLIKEFYKEIKGWSSATLFSKIIEKSLRNHGYNEKVDFPLSFPNGIIDFVSTNCVSAEKVTLLSPYFGEEYALFKLDRTDCGNIVQNPETICVPIADFKLFSEIVNDCEYLRDEEYYLCGDILIGQSRHLLWKNTYRKDENNIYAQIEQMNLMAQIGAFLHYADERFRDAYYEEYKNFLSYGAQDLYIFTEGSTDWKHLKYHWEYLKDELRVSKGYRNFSITFHEYEPENSLQDAKFRMQMDGNILCDMCSAYSKKSNKAIYIFVADRDKDDVAKKLSDSTNAFKYWGNNVYSIVLPVPKHRALTPKICIEHYYSNTELKTEFYCSDGVKRRLFIGNEFDSFGRAIAINRFCTNRNACGSDSIRIIDGSSNERVISLTESSNTNYALSKMQFVENVCSGNFELNSATKEAFSRFFEVILLIEEHSILQNKAYRK